MKPSSDRSQLPVSVLMPVRDGAAWLVEAIESVRAQTLPDWELVIVDDGSVDGTPAIIAAAVGRDVRIVAVRQPPLGLVAALNRGLATARGRFVARLDADDEARPDRLAVQFAAMDAPPAPVLLGSWAEVIDAAGEVRAVRRPDADPAALRARLARSNPFIHSAVMVRAETVREIGGYRPAFQAAEDYDLWLRLAERGAIAMLPLPLCRYREHAGGVSRRSEHQQLYATRLAQRAAALRRAAPDGIEDLPPPTLWSGQGGAYAAEVAVFRVLAWAEPADVPAERRGECPDRGALGLLTLRRRERRLARLALRRLDAAFGPEPGLAGLWRGLRLDPLRSAARLRAWLRRR